MALCSYASSKVYREDGVCYDTVLRFLHTPSPEEYCFDSDIRAEEERMFAEDNFRVVEYLLQHQEQQPPSVPGRAKQSKTQELKIEQAVTDIADDTSTETEDASEEDTTSEGAITNDSDVNVAHDQIPFHISSKCLKLTEMEMVEALRHWKYGTGDDVELPVVIKEANVYSFHPADLVSGERSHYFYNVTRYSRWKKSTRLRTTENGFRWKQQGRMLPIRENGRIIAYKTYLSYVELKNHCSGGTLRLESSSDVPRSRPGQRGRPPVEKSRDADPKKAPWSMEEIGLAEDISPERVVLLSGGKPQPFPVICRLLYKTEKPPVIPTSSTLQTRQSRKRAAVVSYPQEQPRDCSSTSRGSTMPPTRRTKRKLQDL